MGWYPATTIDLQTVVTIECLEKFRLLKVIANVIVRDFVTTLETLTSPMEPEDVAVLCVSYIQ